MGIEGNAVDGWEVFADGRLDGGDFVVFFADTGFDGGKTLCPFDLAVVRRRSEETGEVGSGGKG